MKRFQFQLLSRESESKEFEDVKILKEVKFKFPASNSLTGVDRKYFEMIRSEADWGNSTAGVEEQEPRRRGLPESFSLTETDREYFNIIKTEDGLSQFFKSVRTPAATAAELPVVLQDDSGVKEGEHHQRANFKYHIVTSSNKRIVGLYLPHE